MFEKMGKMYREGFQWNICETEHKPNWRKPF